MFRFATKGKQRAVVTRAKNRTLRGRGAEAGTRAQGSISQKNKISATLLLCVS